MEVAHERTSSWQTTVANIRERMIGIPKKVKKIGEDDPRRIFHALKVGLALTIAFVFYCINPLFNDFRASAMWAVLTVVVVMEFTVGGTLCKGLNRTFATLSAGALAFGVHHIADLAGEKGEPVVLGVFMFILASVATFFRFVPEIKKKYDYGVVIFILTFSLVAASSYRTNEVLHLAKQRFFTISIGVVVCLCTVMLFFPVWAGEDLHKLEALNLEKLATYLEGLANGYSGEKDCSELEDESFKNCYKSVLNSKATEDALANFARWELCHGRFCFRHPWSQYLKIGELSRKSAYSIDVLMAFTNGSQNMIKKTEETYHERRIRMACFDMSSESSKALNELATGIRTFKFPSAANQHLAAGMAAGERLSKILMEEGPTVTRATLYAATVSSLLSEVVDCVRQSAAGVEELARFAHFKVSKTGMEPMQRETVKPVSDEESSHVMIPVEASETGMEPMHRETVKPVSDEESSHVVIPMEASETVMEPMHRETVKPVSDEESSHVVIPVETSETLMQPMHRETVKLVSDEERSYVVIPMEASKTGMEPMHRETKSVSDKESSHVVIPVEASETVMKPMHKETVKESSYVSVGNRDGTNA